VLSKNGLPRHTCNRIASVSICGHQRLICVISGNAVLTFNDPFTRFLNGLAPRPQLGFQSTCLRTSQAIPSDATCSQDPRLILAFPMSAMSCDDVDVVRSHPVHPKIKRLSRNIPLVGLVIGRPPIYSHHRQRGVDLQLLIYQITQLPNSLYRTLSKIVITQKFKHERTGINARGRWRLTPCQQISGNEQEEHHGYYAVHGKKGRIQFT
jgi:hypothetical protein